MMESASRSRLLELRRELGTARDGRALLDRKREAILRAINDRLPQREMLRAAAATRLSAARATLLQAQIEPGRTAIDAAALAQRLDAAVQTGETRVVGVRLPRITIPPIRYLPRYGPCSGSTALDDAGRLFAELVADLLAFACADAAVRRLQQALARTVKRLNALDTVVVPQLARDIRFVTAAVEEDERDEAVRRNRWHAQHDQPPAAEVEDDVPRSPRAERAALPQRVEPPNPA